MKKRYFIFIAITLVAIIIVFELIPLKFGFVPTSQTPLKIPTYDNSYQAMHPDVWCVHSGWHGWKYWMAMSPLTDSNESVENPSLVVSNDGLRWLNAPNILNPLEYVNGSHRHNNDPDLIYNSYCNELYIYYLDSTNQVEGLGTDYLKLIKYNGTGTTAPKVIRSAPNYYMVSPTVTYNNGYEMWMVNTTNTKGCHSNTRYVEYYTSTDGEIWYGPMNTTGLELEGYKVWHINAQWIPSYNEYWMIILAMRGPCNDGTGKLFFAKSGDGINWIAYNSPFMTKDNINSYSYKIFRHSARKFGLELENRNNYNSLYRTAFYYDDTNDLLKIWYSANMKDRKWYTFYTEVNYNDFSNNLEKRESKMLFYQTLKIYF